MHFELDQQSQQYLDNKCQISNENPAIFINWHDITLKPFVQLANELSDQIPLPDWISCEQGQMTIESFQNDVMQELSRCSGGRCGLSLLAPNTLEQFEAVITRISSMSLEPLLQEAISIMPSDVGLASIYVLVDNDVSNAHLVELPEPAHDICQLFH